MAAAGPTPLLQTAVQLKGGFYQARSLIASAQRCVNLYPEKNPEDSDAPFTMYLTPGLKSRRVSGTVDGPAVGAGRGSYRATNGVVFIVVGQTLYTVDANWVCAAIGTLVAIATTPVKMQDNGITLFLVDGSTTGYLVDLATNVFAQYTAVDNFFGADTVDYVDTFTVFNLPNTKNFYCTLSNSTTIDPTYIAGKTGLPDKLATLIVMHKEIWLLGAQKSSEVFYDSGGAAFPFSATPGVFIEQGCIAKYSVAKHDLQIFWLSQDQDGQATVFMGTGYAAKRISTPAIAAQFSLYSADELAAAVGMVYKQQDHAFYVLSFSDATWVYDLSEGLWHERNWIDSEGAETRWRPQCLSLAYGEILALDWENGSLYTLDLDTLVDEVNGTGALASPIVRRRGFPHIIKNGVRVQHVAVRCDVQCGEEDDVNATDVTFFLRWSDNRGRTFGNPIELSFGLTGDFMAQPRANQLGMARDRVYEVFWSAPVKTALQGIWLDLQGAGT